MLLLLFFLSFFYTIAGVPVTVDNLNVGSYLGRWYQVYGSPTNVIFQGYGACITADYGLLPNGNVSVLNSQLNIDDEIQIITGYAYYKDISEPGKLTVHLNGVPVDSPYWVVKLGALENNQYQYSIITTPSGISLWVLVRNIEEFFQIYYDEVLDFLDENNFIYVPINQENCPY
jgi:lipocalin